MAELALNIASHQINGYSTAFQWAALPYGDAGTTDDGTLLFAATTSRGAKAAAEGKPLAPLEGTYYVTGSVTAPAGLVIKPIGDVVFSIATTKTLTIPATCKIDESAGTITFTGAGAVADSSTRVGVSATQRVVRAVATANVADLAACSTTMDGLTLVENDLVLLPIQTTAAQCGIYKVGVVAAGAAPLTRVSWAAAGMAIKNGMVVEVAAGGTLYGGSSWKAMGTSALVWGTNDPLFYPRNILSGASTVTLTSGTITLGAGLWLFATTRPIVLSRNTAAGTLTDTIMYVAPVANRTAGKVGTAAAVVRSAVAAGTIMNTDTSTVDVFGTNW